MILEFLKTNYQLLVVGLVAIIEIVVFFLKKKPAMNYDDHIKSRIEEVLPSFIKLAETSKSKGSEKLAFVVDLTMKKIRSLRSSKDDVYWMDYIIYRVEDILSTPQKKG